MNYKSHNLINKKAYQNATAKGVAKLINYKPAGKNNFVQSD